MIHKNVLIGGCSFSESKYSEMSQVGDWVPYSDLIQKNHPNLYLKNTARASASNTEISENIVNEIVNSNFNYDFVIVQWTAIGRNVGMGEKEWLSYCVENNLIDRLSNYDEYSDKKLPEGRTSSQNDLVSYYHYKKSLIKIKLTQSFLEYHKIPYVFFWGWRQITDDVYKEHKKLVDTIYSANWWYPNHRYDGFLQYVINNIGEEDGISNDNLHPSSEGHLSFFNNIVNPILNDK